MYNLTSRQEQVLQLIKQYTEETGYPPTRAEIARILGFKSANAAEEHIKALARKGAIEIMPGASRGIRLTESQSGIPIVGRVAAGNPILAQEHIEDYCNIPNSFFSPSADYFLRVHGMSMKDAGILDGDLLAVHRTDQVRNGQIVVARIGEEVTVKRFKRQGNQAQVELWPENPDFKVIHVDMRDQEFSIEGLSVGVIRRD
ncbi:transcriptional repressor LexA [Cellvibrio japonicus]|uniref:LexA repressor n=1 Tax=Cellvibrio japonicus (strain Ueda107) TaxID=498211 RepID=LEXA_CELJU|nr:transcriptional repressor LexA [Cellvibrio japonicus]B3PEX1.1 RecName: Full=LexA repressor [Cellvibrio japonicus Ueda107]ACE84955.1 LexA repressor [Cellvibrio japonicus Ueda107]QEI12219.1 transcriptional repressor LexA [Cellvibrio japonicus]QEI15793.1 transcriptional repressor LexA [Cellvibrio japonicus]QEI19371.1 transcriptional repressor LexA [Cellvibrio japonicus]